MTSSLSFGLPVSHGKSPLAIHFTFGNVYFNTTLSSLPTVSLSHFDQKSVYVCAFFVAPPIGSSVLSFNPEEQDRREVGGRFKREETCVCLWLIHVDTWQKPSLYCKVIILQFKNFLINFFKKGKFLFVITIISQV